MAALTQQARDMLLPQQAPDTPDWLAAELEQTERVLMAQLRSAAPLTLEAAGRLIKAGGKRLRPHLFLLSAHACGYTGTRHIQVAAAAELLHSATLVHDDVVDAASSRRGQPSVNATWGDAAGVLVGDFLYARALQLLVGAGSQPVLRALSDAMLALAEGEVMQLSVRHSAKQLAERHYLQVIERKTATLFAATAQAGALLAGAATELAQCCNRCGHYLGLAFQIADDVLDYLGEEAVVGKPCGSDFATGKITLPLILALRRAPSSATKPLRDALARRVPETLRTEAIALVRETGAAEEALERARQYQAKALAALDGVPPGEAAQCLRALVSQAVARDR